MRGGGPADHQPGPGQLLAADLKEPFEEVRDVVRLLSYYDCFVVGSRPRDQEERCCTGTF